MEPQRNQRSIKYQLQQCHLNAQKIQEIQKFNDKTQRLPHGQDQPSNFMTSLYLIQCKQRNIPLEKIDRSLWNLNQWRLKNIQTKTSVAGQHTVSIPRIKEPFWKQEQAMKIDCFAISSQKDALQKKYYFFDTIYHMLLIQSNYFKEKNSQIIKDKIKEHIKSLQNRDYTDDDKKFISKVAQAYAIYSFGGDKYKEANIDSSCGMIPAFPSDQKIGLLGDWGTGLADAFSLLDHLVNVQNVNYILHLGDVYYAGFPEQFSVIEKHLQELRKSTKRDIKYYCVPGNHDYYTYGGPFIDHIKNNNSTAQSCQKYSFFCLRDQKNTLQFIGIDTGKNQHAMSTIFNTEFEGTYLQDNECEWANRKIKQFPGQTILISHHPLFSAYDSILGQYTYYGEYNQQINYQLSEQLFEVLPKLSCWYWGHEHRCVKYKDWAYGVPKCRLLGNSGFQNNENKLYKEKYNKIKTVDSGLEPQRDSKGWYNHTAAIFKIKDKDNINVRYIQMPATYREKTEQCIQKFEQDINKPTQSQVFTWQPYYIKQSSGLSFSYTSNYIWLDYQPSRIYFENVSGKESNVISNKVYYLRAIDLDGREGYLYLAKNHFAGTYYLYVSEQKKQSKQFHWRIFSSSSNLRIGDTFNIQSEQNGLDLRTIIAGVKAHYYYTLSTYKGNPANDERLAKFQVYPVFN